MGGTLSHAGSSGAEGISPVIRWDRMNIPSELTTGMPNHPRRRALISKPARREMME